MRPSTALLILVALAGCGSAAPITDNPCLIACNRMNTCNKMNTCRTQPIPRIGGLCDHS